MSEYTPTTEDVRGQSSIAGWLLMMPRCGKSVDPEMAMPCADTKPHAAHVWQMSATGFCLCAGVVTEEPEWEYEVTYSSASAPSIDGYRMRRSSGILPSLAMVAERMGFSQNAIAHRRTKAVPAGEWERVPVKQEGAADG